MKLTIQPKPLQTIRQGGYEITGTNNFLLACRIIREVFKVLPHYPNGFDELTICLDKQKFAVRPLHP